MDEYIYDAFISYSHRDLKWARWVQRKLETFPIPRELVGQAGGRRRLRVFRDQTDLAGVEVQLALQKELRASRYLIVICSPSSAASHWVDDEIRFFQGMGRVEQIVPFIVGGEPESDNAALECYPPALRSIEGHHPLGANVQEIGRNKAFLKLMAILLDVRFNRLVDREKQRKRRRALFAGTTAAAVAAFASLLLWRNAAISRKNQELSYDIYGAAIVSIAQKDVIEPADVAFLQVSAEAGNASAAMLLADCFQNGWGTEQNAETAFTWFRRAAEAGDTTGMVALANCYSNGTGTAQDPEQAFSWNMKAAENGEPAGMLNVGICCEEGIGTVQDAEAALRWYKRSAEAGNDLGMYNLARCYKSGIGTQEDPEEAFFWIEKLAETGNTVAMYNMGLMYQYGYGTEENARQAYLWYRKAAEAGDSDAMYRMGWCTENGYGSENAALEWYRMAMENGNQEAQREVARLSGER